jgi:polyhydroxyalkanoate synthesis repressor PhaR
VADREQGAQGRLIKRYENRKLYDPAARRYATLDDLARMVAAGEELRVEDQKTGEDLTTLVLAQVVLEGIKQRTTRIPREVLARLIRLGMAPGQDWPQPPTPAGLALRARQEAERIASELLGRGRLSIEEALALRQEIAQSVQRLAAETQRGLEARLSSLIESGGDAASPALKSLKHKLMALEAYLAEPAGETRGRRSAGRARSGRGRRR